ncbi:LysM peptidoglycan-binding domain-containing protein [Pontimonas sp.]|nr:LysM peptidoglycan-binding domain-containing protein [Pontimonas sp.]
MAPHTTSLRITRRGRFVLSALLALPVLVVSLFLAAPGALADSAEVGDSHDYVTVLAGDTLWTIAESVAPESDPRDVVHEIMKLNQLSSAALTPGQEIAIPLG